jgi:hypothetical protein
MPKPEKMRSQTFLRQHELDQVQRVAALRPAGAISLSAPCRGSPSRIQTIIRRPVVVNTLCSVHIRNIGADRVRRPVTRRARPNPSNPCYDSRPTGAALQETLSQHEARSRTPDHSRWEA